MSMRVRLALVLLPGAVLVLSASPAGGAEAWRWRDAEGGVHFGDRPPPGAAAERLRLPADPAAEGDGTGAHLPGGLHGDGLVPRHRLAGAGRPEQGLEPEAGVQAVDQ